MYSIDLFPIIVITIFLLLYNPTMTVIFINQRFDLTKLGRYLNKRLIMLLIFVFTFFGQCILKSFGPGSEIWLFVYFITITIVVVWDRIAKMNEKKN